MIIRQLEIFGHVLENLLNRVGVHHQGAESTGTATAAAMIKVFEIWTMVIRG